MYRGVVIANGIWDPRWPEYAGEFAGEAIHSAEFKTADMFAAGKGVLVVGGNSGCVYCVRGGAARPRTRC